MFVQFPTFRVKEYGDIREFYSRVGRWLATREGENSYLLSELATLMANPSKGKAWGFVVEDSDSFAGAGVLFGSGCLLMTWVAPDAMKAIVDQLGRSGWPIKAVFAPGHISWGFAEVWAERTNQRFEFDRSERIYQLARSSYSLPSDGRLEMAMPSDAPYLVEWLEGFVNEAQFELAGRTTGTLLKLLIESHSLFVWKMGGVPVSMAAMVAPTPRGASINFVYTPPEHRGRGFAKAAVAALGAKMLAGDRKYCFIFADTQDHRKHKLFQEVGARTVCEFLRCTLHAKTGHMGRDLMGAGSGVSRVEGLLQAKA